MDENGRYWYVGRKSDDEDDDNICGVITDPNETVMYQNKNKIK